MQSQESMFEQPEPTPARPINTDLREQQQRQDMPPAEGDGETYHEYSEGYGGEGYSEAYHTPYADPLLMEGEKLRPRQRPVAKKRNIARPLLVLLLIVALVTAWSGFSSHSRFDGGQRGWPEHSHSHFDGAQGAAPAQSLFVDGAPTIVVNSDGGSVHIHAGDSNHVLVSTSDGSQVKTEQDGNTIDIGTDGSPASLLNDDQGLDITVPVASNLQIHNSSGDIQIDGVNGQMSLSTASGNIELEHALLRGDSSFKSESGQITVEGAIDSQGHYLFQTDSGDVKLTLPQNSSFHLIRSTDSGSFENGFEGPQSNNASGPQVTIHTESGSITVQPQDD